MNEAEQLETAALYFDLALTCVMLFLSVVSGYLGIAYIVGSRLREKQMLFISGVFVVFALFSTWGSSGFFLVAEHFYKSAESYKKHFPTDELIPAYVIVLVIELVVIVVSLVFMRDIRRKTPMETNIPEVNPRDPNTA